MESCVNCSAILDPEQAIPFVGKSFFVCSTSCKEALCRDVELCTDSQDAIAALTLWEDVVRNNEKRFKRRFCPASCTLCGVWWSSSDMKIICCVDMAFIYLNFFIDDWLAFLKDAK